MGMRGRRRGPRDCPHSVGGPPAANFPAFPIPQKLGKLGKLGKLSGMQMNGELIAGRLHAFPLALCIHAGPGSGCPPGVAAMQGVKPLRRKPPLSAHWSHTGRYCD